MQHYLFGYGSLINAESRARTGDSGQALPVRVAGLQRGWNFAVRSRGLTAVGVTWQSQAQCNGVLVAVSASELPKFDARERGYERLPVPPQAVTVLSDAAVPVGNLWVYAVPRPQPASTACPIVQSYVDIILLGCLDLGQGFAHEFIDTTSGWEAPWVDDRQQPAYQRAMAHVSEADTIDALLQHALPQAFQGRVTPA
jgi:hypothetical protein